METHCDYKISSTIDTGNKVTVKGYFSEGHYEMVADVYCYVRTNRLGGFTLVFEHSPATEEEIKRELLRGLEDIKAERVIIDECL